ncbi:glycosyltransferase family 2 protein [Methanofollis liminatans]|nr:glycosyltransferase family 2 protein [Methanofollis liminatans]
MSQEVQVRCRDGSSGMQERGVHPGYAPLRGRVLTDDPASLATLTGCAEGQTIAAMPAYNEEQYIAKTIVGAYRYVDLVLVIDDGSSDATVEIAQALGALVIRHRTNLGYGGALRTIFSVSRTLGAGALVILDSDGQHSPDDLPALLNGLEEGSDVVIGSRFLDGSKGDIPAYRKVGMKVLDTATQFAGGDLKVSDSQSGFRAYGRRAIGAVHVTGEGMSAGSEILIQAADAGLAISEVPITVRYDIEGTSSENPVSHGVGVLMNIVRLISLRRPLVFFGIPGALFTGVGLAAELYAFSEFYQAGQFHYIVFTGGIFSLMLGLLLVTTGLILYSLVEIMGSQKQCSGGNSNGL